MVLRDMNSGQHIGEACMVDPPMDKSVPPSGAPTMEKCMVWPAIQISILENEMAFIFKFQIDERLTLGQL